MKHNLAFKSETFTKGNPEGSVSVIIASKQPTPKHSGLTQ